MFELVLDGVVPEGGQRCEEVESDWVPPRKQGRNMSIDWFLEQSGGYGSIRHTSVCLG